MTITNPAPYDLQPTQGAKALADGRCAVCGTLQALTTMQRDAGAGVFSGLYCSDCAAGGQTRRGHR